jgi:hypothetical protein
MEYWVKNVKMKDNHIQKVKAFVNTVEGLKNQNLFKRKDIVKSIDEKGNNWYTCVLKETIGGKRVWQKGAKIHTVEINGKKYLRTDANKKESDNLDKLPPINKNYNKQIDMHKEIDRNVLDI